MATRRKMQRRSINSLAIAPPWSQLLSGKRRFASAIAETRQCLDIRAAFALRHTELVELLQIQPELGARAEEVPQTKGRVPSDCSLPIEDVSNPIRRHPELTCQLRRAHIECLKLFGQMLAGMNCATRHNSLLVVIHHF